jgi:hypothetical protein
MVIREVHSIPHDNPTACFDDVSWRRSGKQLLYEDWQFYYPMYFYLYGLRLAQEERWQ